MAANRPHACFDDTHRSATQRAANQQITRQERIRRAERTHRNVIRCPWADARQLLQVRDRVVPFEHTLCCGARESLHCQRTRTRQAQRTQLGQSRFRQTRGSREINPIIRRLTEARRDAPAIVLAARTETLLADHRAHRN